MAIKNNNVVKSNDLITASYKLTLNEQRLILAVLAKYDQLNELPQVCNITVDEFKTIFNDNHRNAFSYLKKAVNSLYERDIYYYTSSDYGWRVRWVQFIEFSKEDQKVVLEFSNKIIPYLSNLKEKFTQYKVKDIAPLKSVNSIRLFEFIQSRKHLGVIMIYVDDFRKILRLEEKYKSAHEFKRRVLEPSLMELNTKLNLNLNMQQLKEGRKITGFKFTWAKDNTIIENNSSTNTIKYNNELSFFDLNNIDNIDNIENSKRNK